MNMLSENYFKVVGVVTEAIRCMSNIFEGKFQEFPMTDSLYGENVRSKHYVLASMILLCLGKWTKNNSENRRGLNNLKFMNQIQNRWWNKVQARGILCDVSGPDVDLALKLLGSAVLIYPNGGLSLSANGMCIWGQCKKELYCVLGGKKFNGTSLLDTCAQNQLDEIEANENFRRLTSIGMLGLSLEEESSFKGTPGFHDFDRSFSGTPGISFSPSPVTGTPGLSFEIPEGFDPMDFTDFNQEVLDYPEGFIPFQNVAFKLGLMIDAATNYLFGNCDYPDLSFELRFTPTDPNYIHSIRMHPDDAEIFVQRVKRYHHECENVGPLPDGRYHEFTEMKCSCGYDASEASRVY